LLSGLLTAWFARNSFQLNPIALAGMVRWTVKPEIAQAVASEGIISGLGGFL
jgi:hypothetical protein